MCSQHRAPLLSRAQAHPAAVERFGGLQDHPIFIGVRHLDDVAFAELVDHLAILAVL